MQLHLQFQCENLILPVAYRHYVQSMLYGAFRQLPGYDRIHDTDTFKLFTFGQLEGAYTLVNREILFPKGARLEVRSADDRMLMGLFSLFSQGSLWQLGKNNITVSSARLENARVHQSSLTVATCSPVVAYVTLEDNKTVFYSPEQAEFYRLVAANARKKWIANGGSEEDFSFRMLPLPQSPFRKQVTGFKTTRITAWSGQFLLEGPPEVLNFLYHTGLGAKSSQGFGMFRPL